MSKVPNTTGGSKGDGSFFTQHPANTRFTVTHRQHNKKEMPQTLGTMVVSVELIPDDGVLPSLGSVSRISYVLQLPFSKKDQFQEVRTTVFSFLYLGIYLPQKLYILQKMRNIYFGFLYLHKLIKITTTVPS